MTLQEKINQAFQMMDYLACLSSDDAVGLKTIRDDALRIKKLMQGIATTARAAQKRKCTHAHLDAGHRSIHDWNGVRKVTRHFNCVDCGKSSIKVEVVSEESVIRGDD